ncbi:MAG: HDOD domain-containing protein [Syntrophobacteraceae bacterium]
MSSPCEQPLALQRSFGALSPRRRLVPSGSLAVYRRKDEILEAFLGTCIGLTLRDTKAEVGGLLHLLLPKPPGVDSRLSNEAYATTGLPLFLAALLKEGAQVDRLEACVAGGGLLGETATPDPLTDIGGRTVEYVIDFLNDYKIPILKSEIGGSLGCRMALNLRDFETDIQFMLPASPGPPAQSQPSVPKPTREDLLSRIDHVRPIPQTALRIIRMVGEQRHSTRQIAREVAKDQVISATTIRFCNSVVVGSGRKIDSIDRALVILGDKRLLQFVISRCLVGFFSSSELGYSLCKGGLFRHALGTATISQRLALLTGRISADLAYTAGLIHDIGKVVLDQFVQETAPLFYWRAQSEKSELIALEEDTFGMNHAEAGRLLAERWDLPENLLTAIASHHHPESVSTHSDLAHLVYVADLVMSRVMTGQEIEKMDPSILSASLERLGIGQNEFSVILDGVLYDLLTDPLLSV